MNDSQYNHISQCSLAKRRTQRGVSLIEVLVVLVILVVGILTIIRLFPSGFFSIQSTGNAALANSLGSAAINLGAQSSENLPEAILPDDLTTDDLTHAQDIASAYLNADYDPDDPNNLNRARVVSNETVTVPSVSKGSSIYVVKYGPVLMPADPTTTAAQLFNYFTVNSPYWSAQSGVSTPELVAGSTAPVDVPQQTLVPGHEQFLVDLADKRIAVPYAAYTLDGTTSTTSGTPAVTVQNANSYAQKMVLTITCYDTGTGVTTPYTVYLDVPAGTPKNGTNPNAPFGADGRQYLADVPGTAGMGDYQGGWFDPTTQYTDSPAGSIPPNTATTQWVSVTLYRPYNGLAQKTTAGVPIPFSNDPYEFKLTAANIATLPASGSIPATGANPGAVGFNPKAASGSGAQARKAQISYIVDNWSILSEDHDIPSLSGGDTFAVRTTVPNLLLAGSANPDNSINPGLAGGNYSLVILDLDTGQTVVPSTTSPDPTVPDAPINNEDENGPMTGPAYFVGTVPGPSYTNVSYALGRLTFASDAFGDNSNPQTIPNQSGTAPAHRIRIFYTADLNWAVAVQKAPAYFSEAMTAQTATGTTALGASQFAYDSANAFVYFARCNAGKTVEIDGSYVAGGQTKTFSDTVSIDPTLYNLGDTAVRVNLNDATKFAQPVPTGAAVTFNAVRGLSARSVVAWKERNLYKVHTVDAVLNRNP